MTSATARIIEDLAIYGAGPIPIEDDPLPEDRDIETGAASLIETVADLFADTALETHTNDIAWQLVNVFHRKIDLLTRDLDENELRQRSLIAEQDGSEVKSVELERQTDKGQALLEHVRAFEDMRDALAATFEAVTGSPWIPRSRSVRAKAGLTSAIIDANDFARARKQRDHDMHVPEGPRIAFGGGADWTDIDHIQRTLDKVRERHPNMVLCHGGQSHGAERIAASWAHARGVSQLVFKPDFAKHGKAAPFRRNDAMVGSGLAGAVLFPGNGITLNLGQKAEQAGVKVLRCGFSTSTKKGGENHQRTLASCAAP